MWGLVEKVQPGLHRDDPKTWKKYQFSGKYGLGYRGPTFDPTRQKQAKREVEKHVLVLEIPIEDVMVGHDRFTIYRATELSDESYTGKSEDEVESGGSGQSRQIIFDWAQNVHLDLNPWWWLEASTDVLIGADSITYNEAQDFVKENNFVVRSMGPHVQCVLNFSDNAEEDGGTIVVPEFHSHLEKWCNEHAALRKPVPFVTFSDKVETENACEEELLQRSCRVPMRPGSVLIWNQTLAHGTQPNASPHNRTAQFLKAFSRKAVFLNDELVRTTMTRAKVGGQEKGGEGGNVETVQTQCNQRKGTGKSKGTGKQRPGPPKDWVWDGRERLLRRSFALRDLLRRSGALRESYPARNLLFGPDALPDEEKEE